MTAAFAIAAFAAGWVARGFRDRARTKQRRDDLEFSERLKAARKS